MSDNNYLEKIDGLVNRRMNYDRKITKSKILIVDDNRLNIEILVSFLQKDYELETAMDGMDAIDKADGFRPDLILLDIVMPNLDGFQAIRQLKGRAYLTHTPIIFLTSLTDVESKTKGLELGAVDFITKPFEIHEVKARINTHLNLATARKILAMRNEILEQEVNQRCREVLKIQEAALEGIANLAEYRDEETGEHIQRTKYVVRRITEILAQKEAYTDTLDFMTVEMFVKSAPMHDIGKIGISDAILLKPGPLTDEEFEAMKAHTMIGYRALRSSANRFEEHSFFCYAMEMAKSHHERWDGNGYPEGLRGNEIPLSARIMALADVYDALRSDRVYKKAFSQEKTLRIIREEAGSHFDPEVVEAFMGVADECNQLWYEKNVMVTS